MRSGKASFHLARGGEAQGLQLHVSPTGQLEGVHLVSLLCTHMQNHCPADASQPLGALLHSKSNAFRALFRAVGKMLIVPPSSLWLSSEARG